MKKSFRRSSIVGRSKEGLQQKNVHDRLPSVVRRGLKDMETVSLKRNNFRRCCVERIPQKISYMEKTYRKNIFMHFLKVFYTHNL